MTAQKHNEENIHMKDRPYPSIRDILKRDPEVNLEKINQDQFFNVGRGICGGMSTVHVTKVLEQNNVKNPFRNREAYEKSAEIQTRCQQSDRQDECFAYTIAKEYPTANRKMMSEMIFGKADDHYARGYKIISDVNDLKTELKKTIRDTQNDGHARGSLISMNIHRTPNGKENSGGHMLSMTSQINKDVLECTGIESNLFFASGKGKAACDKIAEKLVDTARAYDAYDLRINISKR